RPRLCAAISITCPCKADESTVLGSCGWARCTLVRVECAYANAVPWVCSPSGAVLMRNTVVIENIEEMRREEGIDDVELRRQILGLKVGDRVKLTFLAGSNSLPGETLTVRITSIEGNSFRGKLADRPTSTRLSALRSGSTVVFTGDHIHSLA